MLCVCIIRQRLYKASKLDHIAFVAEFSYCKTNNPTHAMLNAIIGNHQVGEWIHCLDIDFLLGANKIPKSSKCILRYTSYQEWLGNLTNTNVD